ncbi:hypothetical protein Hdeb2414_s0023g00626571 [Helianthus debilis subsp. tardiflorus]
MPSLSYPPIKKHFFQENLENSKNAITLIPISKSNILKQILKIQIRMSSPSYPPSPIKNIFLKQILKIQKKRPSLLYPPTHKKKKKKKNLFQENL